MKGLALTFDLYIRWLRCFFNDLVAERFGVAIRIDHATGR